MIVVVLFCLLYFQATPELILICYFSLFLQQVANMTSKEYAANLYKQIEECCTHDVPFYFQKDPGQYTVEDHGTSHVSVVDQNGNAASVTSTINEK